MEQIKVFAITILVKVLTKQQMEICAEKDDTQTRTIQWYILG